MLQRRTAVVVIAALSILPPVAFASPVDTTWISGIYDDGDYDDVVLLATSLSGTPVEGSNCAVQLNIDPTGLKPDVQTCLDPSAARLGLEDRAPPIA